MNEPVPSPAPVADPSPAPAADLNPAPSPSPSIFSEGLAFSEGWYEGVTDPGFDPYRSTAAQFKDLPTVFKALNDTKAALSQRQDGMVKLPTSQSTPEEIASYHRAIGIPETVDAYEITMPEALPDGVEFAPEMLGAFKEFAHTNGIPPATASALLEFQAKAEGEAISAIRQEFADRQAEAQAGLVKEWGGQYEQKMMLAKRAAETFGLKADHPVMQNPDVVRAMAFAASKLSETSLVSGEKMGGTLGAYSQARDIMANPDNPLHAAYKDSSHPNHEHAYGAYMRFMQEAEARGELPKG